MVKFTLPWTPKPSPCSNTPRSSPAWRTFAISPPRRTWRGLLTPTPDFDEASARLAETSEARKLLVTSDLTIGGAHDIREQVDLAAHGGVLDPKELLDVQSTLVSMRNLRRFFDKHAEASPHLADIACRLPAPAGLIEAIARCITDNGEVADSASPKLYDLRRQVRVAHDRLMARLQRYLTDAVHRLQAAG